MDCGKKCTATMKPIMPLTVPLLGFFLAVVTVSGAEEEERFELRGRVLLAEGKPIRGILPEIRLEGTRFPFLRRTLAKRDGTFKFKKIPATTYQLTISALGKTPADAPSYPLFSLRMHAAIVTDG